MSQHRYVMVTTAHRGIFCGELVEDAAPKRVKLEKVRCIIRFAGTRGFLGIASHGPDTGSRVGSEAPAVTLYDITSVTDCTPKAEAEIRGWE